MIDFDKIAEEKELKASLLNRWKISINKNELDNVFINTYLQGLASELLSSSLTINEFNKSYQSLYKDTLYFTYRVEIDSLSKRKLYFCFKVDFNGLAYEYKKKRFSIKPIMFDGIIQYESFTCFLGRLYSDINQNNYCTLKPIIKNKKN